MKLRIVKIWVGGSFIVIMFFYIANIIVAMNMENPKALAFSYNYIVCSMVFIWACGTYIGFIGPVSEKIEEVLLKLNHLEEKLEEATGGNGEK